MQTIYDAIKSSQQALAEKRGVDPFELPAHLQSEDEACRALDKKLSDAFQTPIQMLQDGLISATEFFEQVYVAATQPV